MHNRLTIRLVLSLTTALLIMLLVSMAITLRMQEDTLRAQAAERAKQFAASQQIQLDLAINTRIKALRVLKQNLIKWQEPHPELRDESGLKVLFDSLWLIDREGTLIDYWDVDANREAALADMPSLADSAVFQAARESDTIIISDPVDNYIGYPPVLQFAYRLKDDQEFLGVVVGNMLLQEHDLFRRLSNLEIGNGGYLSIVSHNGTVLVHPNPNTTLTRLPEHKFARFSDVAEGNSRVVHMNSFNDVPSIISVNRFSVTQWYVAVVQPEEGVYAPMHDLRRTQLQVFGLGGSIAILLFVILIYFQIRPIRTLSKQTERIIAGKAQFLVVPKLIELRPLVERFNSLLMQNITQKRTLEERKIYFDTVLQTSPIGQFMTEPSGKFEFINKKLEELTGFTLAELRNTGMRVHIIEEDVPKVVEAWTKVIKESVPSEIDFRFTRKDGGVIWLHVETTPVFNQGKCLGHVGSVRDVTSSYAEIENLRTLATIDSLTGLLNRRGQEQALTKAIMNARLFNDKLIVLVIDLDGFKAVNDEVGHDMGDQMLKEVAQQLVKNTRETDFIGRMGGDEFIVILPKCPLNRAREIADRITHDIGNIHVTLNCPGVTASIGLTDLRDDDSDFDELVRRADKAAYAAKHAGRNRVFEDLLL
nr:diguanylate cyclase [Aliidiomarina indica]